MQRMPTILDLLVDADPIEIAAFKSGNMPRAAPILILMPA